MKRALTAAQAPFSAWTVSRGVSPTSTSVTVCSKKVGTPRARTPSARTASNSARGTCHVQVAQHRPGLDLVALSLDESEEPGFPKDVAAGGQQALADRKTRETTAFEDRHVEARGLEKRRRRGSRGSGTDHGDVVVTRRTRILGISRLLNRADEACQAYRSGHAAPANTLEQGLELALEPA
jgi:hypothetical protein